MTHSELIQWRKMRLATFSQNLREIADGVEFDLQNSNDEAFADAEMIGLAKAFLGIVDGILRDLVAHPE